MCRCEPSYPRILPSAAETVRTLTSGQGRASLQAGSDPAVPVLQAADTDGQIFLVTLSGCHSWPPAGSRATTIERPAALEITAHAPMADLTVTRAHLDATGWARPVTASEEALARRCLADRFGEHAVAEDGALLCFELSGADLHWPGGCTSVSELDYAAAMPDPLAPIEADLIEQAEAELTQQLLTVVRTMGSVPGAPGEQVDLAGARLVRVIGVDRFGATVAAAVGGRVGGRVGGGDATDPAGMHAVRMPFATPLDGGADAWPRVRAELLGHLWCSQRCR